MNMRKKLIALRMKLADMNLANLILSENASDLTDDEDRYHECRGCGRSFEDKPHGEQCPDCEGEVVTYMID
jgi:rubrerythrin